MKVNKQLKLNPVERGNDKWFKPAKYPKSVYVCPLCHLPETEHVYEMECDCWDESGETK